MSLLTNLPFALPALALVLGILVSAYFFVQWIRSGRRHTSLLFWALGLLMMFWFQVPVILTKAGMVITVSDFNLFFALTLPITFIAISMMYLGTRRALDINHTQQTQRWLFGWFLAAAIFFAYHFIARKGVIETYSLPIVGNLAFYVPLYLLFITLNIQWLASPTQKSGPAVLGSIAVIGAIALGLVRNGIVMQRVLTFPPQFWYNALTGTDLFFILQTISIALYTAGFYLLHRSHPR